MGEVLPGDKVTVERRDLQHLMVALANEGHLIVGPTVRDQAIVYDELTSIDDLPVGWTDEQNGGTYRLKKRSDSALFGYVVGPQSWKKYLHPPQIKLWESKRDEKSFIVTPNTDSVPKYTFIGVRACELNAIVIQDKVFLSGTYVDPIYKIRREQVFIVAVNCGQAGNTCFCVSMNTGPEVTTGFDLALTEIIEANRHYFVIEIGTESGAAIIASIPHIKAQKSEEETAKKIVAKTASQMGRTMDTTDVKGLLADNSDHPRWNEVASRCLTCANCTMVCPTCFCSTVEDVTDLTGEHAERWRKWDSCFTMDFSYIHGGSIRVTPKSRYRQWMTHKLSTWIDQFGTSGCVGCGRCITWCPVAIDITQEVSAIRETVGTTPPVKEK